MNQLGKNSAVKTNGKHLEKPLAEGKSQLKNARALSVLDLKKLNLRKRSQAPLNEIEKKTEKLTKTPYLDSMRVKLQAYEISNMNSC